MSNSARIEDFSPAQQELWRRVEELWQLAVKRDEAGVRAALHPRYTGWEASSPDPHDREFAVRSVLDEARIVQHHIEPKGVEVYDDKVGVVHYNYAATVSLGEDQTQEVVGRWTEIYLKQDQTWIMVGVHGGPE